LAVAGDIATRNAYGGLYASLTEIGYCLTVGAAAVGVILLSRSKARKRAVVRAAEEEIERRRKNAGAPPGWKDMGVITTALPLALKVCLDRAVQQGHVGVGRGWNICESECPAGHEGEVERLRAEARGPRFSGGTRSGMCTGLFNLTRLILGLSAVGHARRPDRIGVFRQA
jgi:hypothetical protein